MEPILFRSSREIASEREKLREARKKIVEKAKDDFQKIEKQKEENKKRGYDDWILPSVLDTIDKQAGHKSKSKKSKKEKKKHKKSKKKKKKSSSESDSDDSSDEELQWIEKTVEKKPNETPTPVSKPTLQRDDWMGLGFDTLPTVSRHEIQETKRKAKEEARKLFEQPGQHHRELNPYWKDGGVGLPQEEEEVKSTSLPHISWLRRAYKRCEEQAKETGATMEEVAAERWGSLKKLESMIKKAEKIEREKQSQSFDRDRPTSRYDNKPWNQRPKYLSRPPNSPPTKSNYRGMFKRPSDSPPHTERKADPADVRSSDSRLSEPKSDSDSERIAGYGFKNPAYRGIFRRPSDSPPHTDRKADKSDVRSSDSRLSYARSDNDSERKNSGSRGMFRRPSDSPPRSERNSDGRSAELSRSSYARSDYDRNRRRDESGFRKDRYEQHSRRESENYVPAWKKKTALSEEQKKKFTDSDRLVEKEESQKRNLEKNFSDSSHSSSSSEDESQEEPEMEDEPAPPSPPVILTEDQMNDLSAKILRAELMGDDDLVEMLQNKLKSAQKAKSDFSASKASTTKDNKKQEEILLTHVDRNGMAWPLLEQEEQTQRQGRQRKKKNIKTHENKGERIQYFEDDGKHDLKKLVQREKMCSAEDQNSMFARLAGRSVEKTDEDYQIDDVFVSRAAKKDSEAKTFDLQKARAIFEHKKMSSAIENCKFCFEKCAKHLLVSIGQKAYLCLPDGASLTEGHCLIIPIQHITSSTAMDEDVWQEVQSFKKSLVKMFSDQNKDTIFMETSMNLNKFHHASIECIPLERDDGAMAPMYFKKAILESESEWCMNKKLVDISQKRDIRKSIPKGFPFFCVNFGMDQGFAHAIEDEKKFSFYFGKEILGGLIDADPSLFRRPRKEQFEVQRQKVLKFAKMWKTYDITQN